VLVIISSISKTVCSRIFMFRVYMCAFILCFKIIEERVIELLLVIIYIIGRKTRTAMLPSYLVRLATKNVLKFQVNLLNFYQTLYSSTKRFFVEHVKCFSILN
jgi:hypothetical protein